MHERNHCQLQHYCIFYIHPQVHAGKQIRQRRKHTNMPIYLKLVRVPVTNTKLLDIKADIMFLIKLEDDCYFKKFGMRK